jgi:hypothetical protein
VGYPVRRGFSIPSDGSGILDRPVKPGDDTAFDDVTQNKSAALSVCRLRKRLPAGAHKVSLNEVMP